MILHRIAWAALVSVIVLILVGATVRVTGSGLGCPDWPTCWGCLIPPTSVDQIDVQKLDIDKFKRKAARQGIDPETITRETILESFNPVHTWIEFGNRLTSLPLGLSVLALALVSFTAPRKRGLIVGLSWTALVIVLVNAVMGAIVVRSGLKPGIITLHMALAFVLIFVLVSLIWMTRPARREMELAPRERTRFLIISGVFVTLLVAEGLLGSQLREQTDVLAKASEGLPRAQWIDQLGATLVFKVHRSFSWTLLLASGLLLWMNRRIKPRPFVEPKFIFGFVVAMMIMGIVLGHVSVFQVVQVLHVGSTAILLAITWHWISRIHSMSGSPSTAKPLSPST